MPDTPTFRKRTHHFTHRVPMTRQAFRARIDQAGDLSTVQENGYVDVLKDGNHVARYLTVQRVLWYEHEDAHQAWLELQAKRAEEYPPEWNMTYEDDFDLPSVDGPWPPTCPECGSEMVLKFGGQSRQPFWSCVQFDVRRPAQGRAEPVCRGKRSFSLHPEELAEYLSWTPPHHPDWSPAANKTHERRQYEWKWQQLAAKSLERLQPQPDKVAVYS